MARYGPITPGRAVAMLILAAVLLLGGWFFGRLEIWLFLVSLPITVSILLVCAAVIYFAYEHRRSRSASAREAAGLCVKCGYDLRHITSDVCPECAMPVWRRCDPLTGKPVTAQPSRDV